VQTSGGGTGRGRCMNIEAWMIGDNDGELIRNLRNVKRITRRSGEYNTSKDVIKNGRKTRKYSQWLHCSSASTPFSFRLNS
jgi:hypothetical protein